MQAQHTTNERVKAQSSTPSDEEEIAGIGFKGIGFVKIKASPGLSLTKALAMAEQAIAMMRDELKQRGDAREDDYASERGQQ